MGGLDKELEGLILHEDDCVIPDPAGCSCGAVLTRVRVRQMIKTAWEDGNKIGFEQGLQLAPKSTNQKDNNG